MFTPKHPENPDLGQFCGSLLTDGEDDFSENPTVTVNVTKDKQVMRNRHWYYGMAK